jgi:hypothetical protein
MTDTNVTPLHPTRRNGRTKSNSKSSTERSRRFREKWKAQRNLVPAPTVAEVVAPPVASVAAVARNVATAPVVERGPVDFLAYTAAIALAGAAAWFSIRGMAVLFPGSPMSVVVLAVAMESAKLITAAWLAARWPATAWIWRLVLITLVAGLAVINAAGVYAQLVASHVGERGAGQAAIETQTATIGARIDAQQHVVADLDRRLSQIDGAIEDATRRGKTKTAMATMEGQQKARAGLVEARKREAGALVVLQSERAQAVAKGRQAETEAAPIRYVAELLGVDTDGERAIRWLIALMVLCADPLAIALTAATAARRMR